MTKTFEEFKSQMNWTMFNFTDEQLETVWESVVRDEYKSMEDVQTEYEFEKGNITYFLDVNLHSVLENFIDLGSEEELLDKLAIHAYSMINLYYLKEDNLYLAIVDM